MEFSELCYGSFQNQTISSSPSGKSMASRKHGIAAALQDATNMPPEDGLNSKRRCKEGATVKLRQQMQKCAPRGNPSAATPARSSSTDGKTALCTVTTDQPTTGGFCWVYRHNKPLYNIGKESMQKYIERNIKQRTIIWPHGVEVRHRYFQYTRLPYASSKAFTGHV